MARYSRLGYVALNVTDIERSVDFYERLLGLQLVGRGKSGEAYFRCSNDHHNVVLYPAPIAGLKRVGFLMESEADLAGLRRRVEGALEHASLGLERHERLHVVAHDPRQRQVRRRRAEVAEEAGDLYPAIDQHTLVMRDVARRADDGDPGHQLDGAHQRVERRAQLVARFDVRGIERYAIDRTKLDAARAIVMEKNQ